MHRSTWFRRSTLQRLIVLLSTTGLSRQLSISSRSRTNPIPTVQNKIVWFRNHALRLNDNEALLKAIQECQAPSTIVPVYLWEKKSADHVVKNGGTASELFTAHSLRVLSQKLFGKLAIGSVVTTKRYVADSRCVDQVVDDVAMQLVKEIISICEKNASDEIFYLRSNDVLLEKRISHLLRDQGIIARDYGGSSLLDYTKEEVPWKDIILAHSWRSPLIPFVDFIQERVAQADYQKPTVTPLKKLQQLLSEANSKSFTHKISIDELLQALGTSSGGTVWGKSIMQSFPQNNEDTAMAEFKLFLHSLKPKDEEKKQTHFTSRLSPFLARGLLSPRQVYHEILQVEDNYDTASLMRRLCWRDYTHAVVSLFPDVLYGCPIRSAYDLSDDNLTSDQIHALNMWKKGQTGIPLVDAGMRQLELEGYMPQKVRLACSTCLVEGLNVPWWYGMDHFEEYLVDYDEAINCNMWMNTGCVGFDPYYCGMKYRKRAYWDIDGKYVKKFCPELKNLPDSVYLDQGEGVKKKIDCLYEPWLAPTDILHNCGVVLGETYPHRVSDDRRNRQSFFETIREKRDEWPMGYIDDCKRDVIPLGRDLKPDRIGIFTPRALMLKAER